MSVAARLTGLNAREQAPMFLVGFGHGGTHWLAAILYILLPFIADDMGLSYAHAGSLIAIFHASAFAANFASGAVVDLTGRRVLFQVAALVIGAIALVIGAIALIGFGASENFLLLAVLVAFLGASNNLWHPAAISFISAGFPRNRGYALSIHALGANLGDAIAPIVAGALLLWLSWRGTAIVGALPILALAFLIAMLLLPRDQKAADGVKTGMSWREYGRGIGQVIRNRAVLGLCLMTSFRGMAQTGLLTFLPLYLANVIGLGPLWLGFALSALQVGGLIATPIAGVWSDRIGRRPVVLMGLGATTVMIIALTFTDGAIFIAGTAVLGFALYAVRPVIHGWMMDLTPPELGGSATSLMFGSQSIFSVMAPAIGGMIADQWGLSAVFYFLAATMLIANLLVYLLPHQAAGATSEAGGAGGAA